MHSVAAARLFRVLLVMLGIVVFGSDMNDAIREGEFEAYALRFAEPGPEATEVAAELIPSEPPR